MKGITILILISISNLLFSQVYLDSSSVWKEYSAGGGAGNPYFTTQDYEISFSGDTLIDNELYYKTLMTGIQITWDWTVDTLVEEVEISMPLQLIREDDGIFYRRTYTSNGEIELHDFNLIIGDTAISTCSTPQIVGAIDTVFVGNIPRKRFTFIGNNVNYLIEGVGSSKGLFKTPCNAIGIESGSILQCYSQNEQFLELDTFDCDGITTSTTEKIENALDFVIYPNPAKDYIEIEFESNYDENVNIQIIDINGIKRLETSINPNKIERIELNNLSSGLYVIIVNDSDKIILKKILKVK